jgi:hypothetical protein
MKRTYEPMSMAKGWSYWRVAVRDTYVTQQWRVWASFALEDDAHTFRDAVAEQHTSWDVRVVHPDSKLNP